MKLITLPLVLSIVAVFASLQGCALFNEMDSQSTEQLLTAGGFQTRVADTPKRQAVLAGLPPYQLQMRSEKGQPYYLFADPKRNIVLVGGPAQYQKYQQLSVQQGIAEEQWAAASEMQMMEVDSMGLWDPFW